MMDSIHIISINGLSHCLVLFFYSNLKLFNAAQKTCSCMGIDTGITQEQRWALNNPSAEEHVKTM